MCRSRKVDATGWVAPFHWDLGGVGSVHGAELLFPGTTKMVTQLHGTHGLLPMVNALVRKDGYGVIKKEGPLVQS